MRKEREKGGVEGWGMSEGGEGGWREGERESKGGTEVKGREGRRERGRMSERESLNPCLAAN